MKEAFMIFLEKEKQNCEEREKALIADERKDEANLCKVEANIFDIFKTNTKSRRFLHGLKIILFRCK